MPYIKELTDICKELECKIMPDFSLKELVTFKFGGNCRALIKINSETAIIKIIAFLKANKIDYTVLGRGSNVIVSDKGYNGVILLLGSDFSDIKTEDRKIICQAGAMLSAVCITAQKSGLKGMENLYGIPGTVGGALYMNAGAYGTEIADVVESAEYIGSDGQIHKISKDEMSLSYRKSRFSKDKSIITSVTFDLSEGNPQEIKQAMSECISKRSSKQPLEYPSAGSTFKRPIGNYASLLIDQCGLKGLSCGDAEVSIKHCGFIINKGNATCQDVLELCENIRKTVKEKTGYELELEPVILGDI